ncbi:MAG: CpXC domain-containing protein [Elusimicrobia bacterium]|nr:CpXC domain-containing protein [Elusimicrobiota bacterium]
MSFKGVVETRCPKGCEPFEAEIWSFINGGDSPELRESLAAQECNLILCPGCGEPFYPEAPYVYYEPQAELLAFVFPESWRDRRQVWLRKMRDDFAAFKKVMGPRLPGDIEPDVFFGPQALSELLGREDYRREEREVMEFVAKDLGLALYRVGPHFARRAGIPDCLPYAAQPPAAPTKSSLVAGLEKLLQTNDRLSAYQSYLAAVRADPAFSIPPAARR